MNSKEISRLTLDIRGGKKTKFSLLFPYFEDKPVRLVEDWRNLSHLPISKRDRISFEINSILFL